MEEEIFRAQLAGRLRTVRKIRDVTQDEAADLCQISARSYKDYELCKRGIPAEVLARFCKAFSVSVDEMMFGRNAAPDQPAENDDQIAEIAEGILSTFAPSQEVDERARRVRVVCYAWRNARAKRRDFKEELSEVSELMS